MDDTRIDPSRPRLTRRAALKLGAAATVGASIGQVASIGAEAQLPSGFLTPAERALLDELCEVIIPADEHSPGARAADVATHLDVMLAEARDEQERQDLRDGLRLVDALSRTMHGRDFTTATADERVAVVAEMAAGEADPQTPEAVFFAKLKPRVAEAYYTSEIGIRQELEYQGNTYLAEFVGFDAE